MMPFVMMSTRQPSEGRDEGTRMGSGTVSFVEQGRILADIPGSSARSATHTVKGHT